MRDDSRYSLYTVIAAALWAEHEAEYAATVCLTHEQYCGPVYTKYFSYTKREKTFLMEKPSAIHKCYYNLSH